MAQNGGEGPAKASDSTISPAKAGHYGIRL